MRPNVVPTPVTPDAYTTTGGVPLSFDEPERVEISTVKKARKFVSESAVLKQLDKRADGVSPQSNLKNAIKLIRAHPSWNVPPVLFYDEFSMQIRPRTRHRGKRSREFGPIPTISGPRIGCSDTRSS